MDINLIVKVASKAWSLNILALMQEGVPGRPAQLLSKTGAGRTAFTQSMHYLIDLGLMERNPGYGHPLRPEYRLTPKGLEIAAIAAKINQAVPNPAERGLLRRAWTIPVLVASQEPKYFSEIKTELVSISDRALSQTLKQLQSQNWIWRKVDTETRPPRPLYQATNTGSQISQAVG